jgi:protoheme IX farnesyltransferase
MCGALYLAAALILNAVFLKHAWRVWRHYSDDVARASFRWSIVYLSLLFAALLLDHYFSILLL